jgi:hypothetical protein
MIPEEPRALKTISSSGGRNQEEKFKILKKEDQDDRQESLSRIVAR